MNWLDNALQFISTVGKSLGGKAGAQDFSDDLMPLPGYSPIANENFDSRELISKQGQTDSVQNSKLLAVYKSLLVKERESTQTALFNLSDDAKSKKLFAKIANPNVRT